MRFPEWMLTWIARLLIWLLAALLTTGFALAQHPTDLAPSSVEKSTVDSLARAFKANADLPGLVVGVADTSEMHVLPYGVAALEDSTRLHADTHFEIGSVTKVFTSLLLAEMVERDALSLSDPIGRYLPDSIDAPLVDGASIEFHHLATHTSGLPRLPSNFNPANRADPYADYTPTKLYAFLDEAQLSDPPGAAYAYSNVGAGLLGHLLARHADTTYTALLERRVLQPLGLDDTGIPAPSDTTGSRLATGHTAMGPASYWSWDVLAGAGALRSTPADLLRFLQMNLRPAEHPLAPTLSTTHTIRHRESEQLALALGWHVSSTSNGARFYWHTGGTGGFRSFVGFSRNSDVALVVLTNEALPLRQFNTSAFQLMRTALESNA